MIYDIEIVKALIEEKYNKKLRIVVGNKRFIPFVSYTTRGMRPEETDGVEHHFLEIEEAEKMIKEKKDDILAYTEINGCKYFTTKDQLKDYNVYIIDPNGIKNLKENHPEIKLNIYYIGSSFNNRYRRYVHRLGLEATAKGMYKFKMRDDSEGQQFTEFENSSEDFHSFINDNPYLNGTIYNIFCRVIDDYDPEAIICFVGRTASGKDTIVKHLVELFNYEEKEE